MWEAELATDPNQVSSGLVTRLAQVPDLRDPRGQRHRRRVILVLLATFRNLSISTIRFAAGANIAHARRGLHDRADAFAVYGV